MLPTGLRALAHRDFRLLWFGQLVSLIGTWMQSVGQAWLVLDLTNSPLLLGLLGTLQYGPMLLFAFVAGALADRVRKRRLVLVTQSVLMLQAFALAALAWTGHVQYWHVAVLAALYGFATTLDMPARQSYVTDLVGKGDLVSAIALNSAAFNTARVVGPAVAGLLIARYGVAFAFVINGLSFVAVILALAAMRTEGRAGPRTGSTMLEDIAEAARYAAATPVVALLLGLLCATSLFVINYNTLVPLIARDVLHEGAHGFGLLMAALGCGAVVGALTLAVAGASRPPVRLALAGAIVVSATTLALGAVQWFWLAAVVLAVTGFAQILFAATCNTLLQVTTPDALRGRIMSLYAFVFVGSTPFGAFLVGAIAEHFGVRTACAVGGGCGLVLVLAMAARWAHRPRSLTDPGGRAPAA
jgi:MFS family permease